MKFLINMQFSFSTARANRFFKGLRQFAIGRGPRLTIELINFAQVPEISPILT